MQPGSKTSFSYFDPTNITHYLVFVRDVGKLEIFSKIFVNFLLDYLQDREESYKSPRQKVFKSSLLGNSTAIVECSFWKGSKIKCQNFRKKVGYFELKWKDITPIMSKWRDSHVPPPFGMLVFEKSLQDVSEKKSKMLKNHHAII